MKTLREDQERAVNDIRDAMYETKRVAMSGPTGMGKTMIISDIVSRALDKQKKVLITVPAISLVDQTMQALWAQDVREVGVIQAAHPMTDWSRPVQVASVQTLQHRWKEGKMPAADIVLVDEVHKMFELFSNWMPDPAWAKVWFIGFSATPWSKGLGLLYDRLVVGSDIRALINTKVLVPFRTFAPDAPDLSGVRESMGDFVQKDLDEVMRPHKLVANIVSTWKDTAIDRPTVCFCCSRAHADQMSKEFNDAGVGAGYLDCDSPLSERSEVRQRMLAGEIKIVCNVDVIGLGVDWPEVSCIIYARPTMSDIRFVQNVGRGLRAAPGKEDLLILDHSTTTMRLGFVDEIYNYHPKLDDGKTKPKKEVVLLPKECPACHLLKPPRVAKCPHCGHVAEVHADPVRCERGTLREYVPDAEMADLRKQLPDKQHVFGQLWWWAQHKGYKPGYAAVKTKEIFGSFPRNREPEPETITAPVQELVNYLYMATERWKKEQYSKRRKERAMERNERYINGSGNGHDHDSGALSERDQAIIDRVREQYGDSKLMTEEDYKDM
jgi:superfamily II DNA or RNA helicase